MLTTVLQGFRIERLQKRLWSQSRRSKLPIMLIVLIVFGTITTVVMVMPVSAANEDYMFCESGDRKSEVTYFSAIFLGNYSYGSAAAKLDFYSYLKDTGKNVGISSTYCWPGTIYGEDTYENAARELEQRVREKSRHPYDDWDIILTKWKPGYSAPLPQDNKDDSHGRESGRGGCYFGECPDRTNPAQRSSQRGWICQTPEGWCRLSAAEPIGTSCGCSNRYGRRIYGTVARSTP